MSRSYAILASGFLLFAFSAASAQGVEKAELIRVYPVRNDVAPVVGELRSQTDDEIELFDLRKLTLVKISSKSIRKLDRDLSVDSVGLLVGLPNMIVWRLNHSLSLKPPRGKIAKLDHFSIYANVGSTDGLQDGDDLAVYRKAEEIRDPDTGEVLDSQRRLVARLKVVEVRERVAKCKLDGELDVELRVGDEVESMVKPMIAVFPLVSESGDVTESSLGLTEYLTSGLVDLGVPLVERTLLDKALTELAIQQSFLFDPENASKLGKQLGAQAVLAGRLTELQRAPAVNVRLIRVDTGEILFSHVQRVKKEQLSSSSSDISPTDPASPASNSTTLSSIDLSRDTRQGSWERRGKKIVHTGGDKQDSLLRVPIEPSTAIAFNMQAPLDGPLRDVTCIAIYVFLEDGEFIAQLAKDGSGVIIDGKDPRSEGTAKYANLFKTGKGTGISATVGAGTLKVAIDGKPFLETKDKRLGKSKVVGIQIGMLGEWSIDSVNVRK